LFLKFIFIFAMLFFQLLDLLIF